jgi:hypothetical protein
MPIIHLIPDESASAVHLNGITVNLCYPLNKVVGDKSVIITPVSNNLLNQLRLVPLGKEQDYKFDEHYKNYRGDMVSKEPYDEDDYLPF